MSRLTFWRQARGFADGMEAALGHPWPSRHSCILHISDGAARPGRSDCGFAGRTEARAARQGRRDCGFTDRTKARAARQGRRDCGFTLVELVTILILVALLAFTAIPRQPALTLGVAAQVDQLAADIRFTQSLAMTHGDRFRINLAAAGYQITDSSGAGVTHPVTQTTAAIALDSMTLSGYNPPLTNNYLAFDGRGVPFAAVTSSTPLAADVTITLAGNGETRTIVVTRDTGRVSLP